MIIIALDCPYKYEYEKNIKLTLCFDYLTKKKDFNIEIIVNKICKNNINIEEKYTKNLVNYNYFKHFEMDFIIEENFIIKNIVLKIQDENIILKNAWFYGSLSIKKGAIYFEVSNNKVFKSHSFDLNKILLRDENRLTYHFSPITGWMNDPNGFSFFNGKYHLFYQYSPYSANVGIQHWGHAVSDDCINWEHLPITFYPEERLFKDNALGGNFTGGACVKNNKLWITFTKHYEIKNKIYDEKQYITSSNDGIYFTEPKLIIDKKPEYNTEKDFRDPNIYFDEELNKFCLMLGSRNKNKPSVLLYESIDNNAEKWNFKSVAYREQNEYGHSFECPEIINLNGKTILLVSILERNENLDEDFNHRTFIYFGKYDKKTGKFINIGDSYLLDFGMDFYAPQTTINDNGDIVFITWMNSWADKTFRLKNNFAGDMTLPRTLKYDSVKELLITYPINIDKYKSFYIDKFIQKNTLNNLKLFPSEWIISDFNSLLNWKIVFRLKNDELLKIKFFQKEQIIYIKHCYKIAKSPKLKFLPSSLSIFFDTDSVEIFINQGESCATMRFLYKLPKNIDFKSDLDLKLQINKIKLF